MHFRAGRRRRHGDASRMRWRRGTSTCQRQFAKNLILRQNFHLFCLYFFKKYYFQVNIYDSIIESFFFKFHFFFIEHLTGKGRGGKNGAEGESKPDYVGDQSVEDKFDQYF